MSFLEHPEDESWKSLQNTGNHLPIITESHHTSIYIYIFNKTLETSSYNLGKTFLFLLGWFCCYLLLDFYHIKTRTATISLRINVCSIYKKEFKTFTRRFILLYKFLLFWNSSTWRHNTTFSLNWRNVLLSLRLQRDYVNNNKNYAIIKFVTCNSKLNVVNLFISAWWWSR